MTLGQDLLSIIAGPYARSACLMKEERSAVSPYKKRKIMGKSAGMMASDVCRSHFAIYEFYQEIFECVSRLELIS